MHKRTRWRFHIHDSNNIITIGVPINKTSTPAHVEQFRVELFVTDGA
jgi:hypothetical protein